MVICGGGATGAAVAYKLAQRGLGPETVMIDKGEVGGGTTVHASGLVGLLKQSKVRWDFGGGWRSLSLPERNGPSFCDVIAGGDQALQDQQRPYRTIPKSPTQKGKQELHMTTKGEARPDLCPWIQAR